MAQPSNRKKKSTREVRRSVEREADRVARRRDEAEAENLEVTDVSSWKQGGRQPVKLKLPSGNVCLAINRGMDAMIRGGNIPNELMPLVESALAKGENRPGSDKEHPEKTPAELAEEVLRSPEKLQAAITMCDMIVLDCVIKPPIAPLPQEGDDDFEERDPNKLYVDELDLEDKFFVMNWVVGGTRNVSRFRKEFAGVVEDLHDGDEVREEAE